MRWSTDFRHRRHPEGLLVSDYSELERIARAIWGKKSGTPPREHFAAAARVQEEIRERDAELLHRFIDQSVYNGATGRGQAIYNEGGNPWLHDQVLPFLTAALGVAVQPKGD